MNLKNNEWNNFRKELGSRCAQWKFRPAAVKQQVLKKNSASAFFINCHGSWFKWGSSLLIKTKFKVTKWNIKGDSQAWPHICSQEPQTIIILIVVATILTQIQDKIICFFHKVWLSVPLF